MNRRRALMAAQSVDDLVLNDLLTLDGIRNTRHGHDASATVWEDISGNEYDTIPNEEASDLVWANDHAVFDATNRGQFISHDFFADRTAGSIELVVQVTGDGSRSINGFKQGFVLANRTGTDSNAKGFQAYSYNSTGISSYINTTSIGYSSTSGGVAYICWTFDNSSETHYVNGEQAHTNTITYSSLTGKSTFRIGYLILNSVYLGFPHCRIYRIGISSTAFTAEQVADRYQRLKRRFNLP